MIALHTTNLALAFWPLPPGTTWQSPWLLLLLVLPLILLVLPRPRRTPAVVLPVSSRLANLTRPTLRQRLLFLPRLLRWLGLSLLILALARPQLGQGRAVSSTQAVAIQVVVDRSGSMRTPMELDGAMLTRLEVVKRVLHDFLLGNGRELKGRPSDVIGLLTFARYADTICPMVRDPAAVVRLAGDLQPVRIRAEDGTSIGDGLALAAARLKTAEDDLKRRQDVKQADNFHIKSKVVVLLTDGNNNCGEHKPLDAAKLCAKWGIKVYTIGIGGGGFYTQHTFMGDVRMPIPDDVDEDTLKAIAETTGGTYNSAHDGESLRKICAEIDQLEKSNIKTVDYMDYKELFPTFASAGAALIALELLLSMTWLRRLPA